MEPNRIMSSKAQRQEAIIKRYRHAQALLNAIECEAIENNLELPTDPLASVSFEPNKSDNDAEQRAVPADDGDDVNGGGTGVKQQVTPDDDIVNERGVVGVGQRIVPRPDDSSNECLLQSIHQENNYVVKQHGPVQVRVQQSMHWESNHVGGLGRQRDYPNNNNSNSHSHRYWRRRYFRMMKAKEGYGGSGRRYRGDRELHIYL